MVEEAERFLTAKGARGVVDAGLIGAAPRVEHYEPAGYGAALTLAQQVGEIQIAEVLQQTLDEKGEAGKRLTQIAESGADLEMTS